MGEKECVSTQISQYTCDKTGEPIASLSVFLYLNFRAPKSHSDTVQLHLQINLESYPTSPAELAAKVRYLAVGHRRTLGPQPSADAIAEQRSEDGAARQARHALGHLR